MQSIGFWSKEVRPELNGQYLNGFTDKIIELAEYINLYKKCDYYLQSYINISCLDFEIKIKSFDGYSTCTICDIDNGDKDIILGSYYLPDGYLHYIINHQIKVSNEFQEYVLNFNFKNEILKIQDIQQYYNSNSDLVKKIVTDDNLLKIMIGFTATKYSN